MKKTLLLFELNDSFATYFSDTLSGRQVDIYDPYRDISSFFLKKLRAISKRINLPILQNKWLADWKKNISQYGTIIIFDNCIRPSLLKWLQVNKNKATKLKIWLWNVPNENIKYLVGNYDVYCFDKEYAKLYDINYIEQFYISDTFFGTSTKKHQYDFYFIGANKNRIDEIESFAKILDENELSYYFYIHSEKVHSQLHSGITVSDKFIDYSKIIETIQDSRVIVEFNKENQTGITIRALESIFYNKKLVTNNINIKNYDFYNHNNIFILGEDDLSTLREFTYSPYETLSEDIINRYKFSTWLEKIVGEN